LGSLFARSFKSGHKMEVGNFLKKHSNVSFQDDINCWVPSRWEVLHQQEFS